MRNFTCGFFIGVVALGVTFDVQAGVIPQSRVSTVEVLGQATDTAGTTDYHQGPQTFSGTGPSSLGLSGGAQSPLQQVTASSTAAETSSILEQGHLFGASAQGFASATLDPENISGAFIPGTLAIGRSTFDFTFLIEDSAQPFTLSGFIAHTLDGISIVSLKDAAAAPDQFLAFASLTGDDIGLIHNLSPITGVLLPGHSYILSLYADATANRNSTAEYDVHLAFIPEVSTLAPLALVLLAAVAVQRRVRA